jgi:hypothetical protein
MPAFVMRGFVQLGARIPQSVERPFHVTLISGSVLDQRHNRERSDEDLTGEFRFHTEFQKAFDNATRVCARARRNRPPQISP